MLTLKTYKNMKKIIHLLVIAATAIIIQSCQNRSGDAKQTADSLNESKDTSTVPETTGGIAVTEGDAKFATAAANGGMAEVALGKLALTKTSNAQVKAFAEMMVKDHGKANDELMSIAQTKNITLPSTVDTEHQELMKDLQDKSGRDFDKAYVDAMVDGHKKTLDLLQDEAKNGQDPELKAFASKTAPVVKTHLDAINKIHAQIK